MLALGFRVSYTSLRPRVDKGTPAKVAALRAAVDASQNAPVPLAVPAAPLEVPGKAARALAKLFRHKIRLPSV